MWDDERRRRSFVIVGLQELPTENEYDKAEQDLLAALDIVRHLGILDALTSYDVRRVGHALHRTMLVTLSSIEARNKILKRKRFLRDIEDTRYLKLYAAYTSENNPWNNGQDYGGRARAREEFTLDPINPPLSTFVYGLAQNDRPSSSSSNIRDLTPNGPTSSIFRVDWRVIPQDVQPPPASTYRPEHDDRNEPSTSAPPRRNDRYYRR